MECEAWVCICSLAGIAGSNPTGGTDVFSAVSLGTGLCWAAHSPRGVVLNAVCLQCDCEGPGLLQAVMPWERVNNK